MSIPEIYQENHDPEQAERAIERLADRHDKVGRLARMMLGEDDYESLEDSK
jgi:hypothetical protein